MSAVVFLLGAGASADAGMPLVAEVTGDLRARLAEERIEFAELFDTLVAEYEGNIARNYERFFEWLAFLSKVQNAPYRKAVALRIDPRLAEVVPLVGCSAKQHVWNLLRSRHRNTSSYKPGYLARLEAFLPITGRLSVFTTNYDLCIEDACRPRGIDVITGFDRRTGRWCPSLFSTELSGINLYKLHGSLNWSPEGAISGDLIERHPPDWDKTPEFILGPGVKLQHDDPYVTLYSEFHRALGHAKLCVVIGHSLGDDHIKEPIKRAACRGMRIIEISPSPSGFCFGDHATTKMRAKDAFESGETLEAVGKYCVDRC
jgi:NAD-dependent SIR2 family protein deacetylase